MNDSLNLRSVNLNLLVFFDALMAECHVARQHFPTVLAPQRPPAL